MESITENMLFIVAAVALILISLVVLNFVRQKKQQVIVEVPVFEVPLESDVVDQSEVSQLNVKPKSEEVLEKFDEFEIIKKIYKILVLEKIYLQQGLTVAEFAKKLGVQTREVTQIFEELYGHTFKELINMYRVEHAKLRIEDGFLDKYTMEALGYEAGFNSRTTFFNVFKKEIGVCPSEYWKHYLEQVV